jgi:peptide/nickel transport system ATP-binding protein
MTQYLVLRATDLTLRYPSLVSGARHVAVNGLSLDVKKGEILAVIGESGSGKSTLAAAIAGHAGSAEPGAPEIAGGSLTVLGRPLRGMSARQRDDYTLRVGYVPQDGGAGLDGHLTVGENVAEPIFERDRHFDQREAAIAVATLIDAVRLPLAIMNSHPHELSRGQRQRVAIARALILEPALLVADDPTAGIDITVRSAILDILRELRAEREFSAIIVSHTVSEVRRVSDRVAVLHRGVLVGLGPIDDVLANPQHPYVERLSTALTFAHHS